MRPPCGFSGSQHGGQKLRLSVLRMSIPEALMEVSGLSLHTASNLCILVVVRVSRISKSPVAKVGLRGRCEIRLSFFMTGVSKSLQPFVETSWKGKEKLA